MKLNKLVYWHKYIIIYNILYLYLSMYVMNTQNKICLSENGGCLKEWVDNIASNNTPWVQILEHNLLLDLEHFTFLWKFSKQPDSIYQVYWETQKAHIQEFASNPNKSILNKFIETREESYSILWLWKPDNTQINGISSNTWNLIERVKIKFDHVLPQIDVESNSKNSYDFQNKLEWGGIVLVGFLLYAILQNKKKTKRQKIEQKKENRDKTKSNKSDKKTYNKPNNKPNNNSKKHTERATKKPKIKEALDFEKGTKVILQEKLWSGGIYKAWKESYWIYVKTIIKIHGLEKETIYIVKLVWSWEEKSFPKKSWIISQNFQDSNSSASYEDTTSDWDLEKEIRKGLEKLLKQNIVLCLKNNKIMKWIFLWIDQFNQVLLQKTNPNWIEYIPLEDIKGGAKFNLD